MFYFIIISMGAPTIEARGQLSVRDLARFQYFHAYRRWWIISALAALSIGLLLLLLLFGLLSDKPPEEVHNFLTNVTPSLILVGFWVLMAAVAPYSTARKSLVARAYLGEATSYMFNNEGMQAVAQSMSYEMKWSVFRRIQETKRLFLMYHAPNMAVVIPKRFFRSQGEAGDWKNFVEQRIAPKKIMRPRIIGGWF